MEQIFSRSNPITSLAPHSILGACGGALISNVYVPLSARQSALFVGAMNTGIGLIQKAIGFDEATIHKVLIATASLAAVFFAVTSPAATPLMGRMGLELNKDSIINLLAASFVSEVALAATKPQMIVKKPLTIDLPSTQRTPRKENPLTRIPSSSSAPILPKGVTINKTELKPVIGDIMDQPVEAIVNAANEVLLGGGGIDGAIHAEAGEDLKKECAKIPLLKGSSTDRIYTGDAVITPSFNISKRQPTIKYIVHTAGPRGGTPNREKLLTDAYRNSLVTAHSKGIRSIAFPAISVGIFGYPFDEAQAIAFETAKAYIEQNPNAFDTILFVYLKSDITKPKETIIHSAWKDKIL